MEELTHIYQVVAGADQNTTNLGVVGSNPAGRAILTKQNQDFSKTSETGTHPKVRIKYAA